jgi:hypothetical protein
MVQGLKPSYSISAGLSTFLCDAQSRIRHRVRQPNEGDGTVGGGVLRKPKRKLLDRTAALSYPDRTEST